MGEKKETKCEIFREFIGVDGISLGRLCEAWCVNCMRHSSRNLVVTYNVCVCQSADSEWIGVNDTAV